MWRETNVSPIWLAVAGPWGPGVRRKCVYAHIPGRPEIVWDSG